MSMDALTNEALKSLLQEVLPRLTKNLTALGGQDAEEATSNPELEVVLGESIELLTLLHNWTGKGPGAEAMPATGDINDDDEAALIEDAGTLEVRCAIHPKMKLTVTVN